MKLMVIILNKVEALEELLQTFGDCGINGATILSSTGMARQLMGDDDSDIHFLGSLRALLNPEREENKTVLVVLKDDQVSVAREAVAKVLGDLSKPDTGILFTVPVDFIEGGSFHI